MKHNEIVLDLKKHLEKFAAGVFYLKPFYRFGGQYGKMWEADLFRVDSNGYVTEYEIKTSYTDFLKDFEKTDNVIKIPNRFYPSSKDINPEYKWKIVLSGLRCNRFFYVISEEIYKKIPKRTRGMFGFTTYSISDNGAIKFQTKNYSKLLSKSDFIPEHLYFDIAYKYRQKNSTDLNLKSMSDAEIIYKCLRGYATYKPRNKKAHR